MSSLRNGAESLALSLGQWYTMDRTYYGSAYRGRTCWRHGVPPSPLLAGMYVVRTAAGEVVAVEVLF